MAFSLVGILAVLLETFRPLIPFLIALVVVDMIAAIYGLTKGAFAHPKARRLALVVGVVAMVAAFISGPALTQSQFGDFIRAIDWVLLAAMSFGVGVAGFILSLPLTSLVKS